MKSNCLILVMLFVLGTGAAWAATTSTMYTASGHPVTVYHYTCAADGLCPASDSSFEAAYGFHSSDRWYSATPAWNCHGRTFDNRQGWVQLAEPWLTYDGPSCPVSPHPGDTVIWLQNGQTSHSVTIDGSWNGLATVVMSKYGAQGQYLHALSNPVAVYGSNWSVTRFSGTTIYSYDVTSPSAAQVAEGKPIDRLLKEREARPWYNSVKASAVLYAVEHRRLVEKSSSLKEATRKKLLMTEDPETQVDLLLKDLADPIHTQMLGAFNGPQFTEDFVAGIEAGKLLVLLGESFPDLKPMIADHLSALAGNSDIADPTRGAAVYFINQVEPARIAPLKAEVGFDAAGARTRQPTGYISYLSFYLGKATPGSPEE